MYRCAAKLRYSIAVFTCLALLIPALATTAVARGHHISHHASRHHHKHHYKPYHPPQSAIVIDGTTGKVLYASNADAQRYPASLTKMMTLYLLFDRLEKRKISLDSMIMSSAHAAAQKPTKLGLTPGESINVELAIKAIVVRSANDVAVAIAEALGGSESEFAEMMTHEAHVLGMRHTEFHNASGLPNSQQITTARDLAVLGRHLAYDFPQYYHYFSTPYFTYQGRDYETHDNLLARFDGADGIKTGYTNASGFNLVTSAVRENKHIIGVVMGGHSARSRDNKMIELLAETFVRARQNPTLVADAHVPWRNAGGTMLASAYKPLDLHMPATDEDADAPDTEDEDAAETATAQNNTGNNVRTGSAAQTPTLRYTPPGQAQIATATPAAEPDVAEGDISSADVPAQTTQTPAEATDAKSWSVQIGAFADAATAKMQLALYAERSMDILGRAKRAVVSFLSVDGTTLYRARFGPFAENEAREVCRLMTERGQTCFAAIVNDRI